MARKRKVIWELGSVFAVPLPDGTYGLGQAVALMMPNVVYCALTRNRVAALPPHGPSLTPEDVVARVALTREQLDYGAWPVLGSSPLLSEKRDFANEQFATAGYVGAKLYDAALAEDFLAAYHGLALWDDWQDPQFFDAWLASPQLKPARLRLKVSPPAS